MIPFNKPHLTGNETKYINDAVSSGKISGNGKYTQLCQTFFEKQYSFQKCLLTTSCTDALEMAAILINIGPGDEVIIPSFTFVSTANAFVLRGATIVFADSQENNPNIDADKIENLISNRTKAIVVVHYAGIACEMNKIMTLSKKYNLFIIEDAAQAIDNYYIDFTNRKIPLGSMGHLAAFSFHETKNIISGEGGMLVINDKQFLERAEIIWEKGTNRSSFFRGEIDKYGWVDLGSSFLPSEITAAFLWSQLEMKQQIQSKRLEIWNKYYSGLNQLVEKGIFLPIIPSYSTNNAHLFFIITKSFSERSELITFLKKRQVHAVFHYLSLHKSIYYESTNLRRDNLPNSDKYSERLLRIPLFYDLNELEIKNIIDSINEFYLNI